jgi:hypothetical protein
MLFAGRHTGTRMKTSLLLFKSCSSLALSAGLFALSSCTTPKQEPPKKASADDSYWHGDGVSGAPRIVINLSEQRAYYYKGGQLVGESRISSGREGNSTAPGHFRVTEKDIDHRSSLYGSYVDAEGRTVDGDVDVKRDPKPPGTRFLGASMRYFMRFNGAIGMHEGYLPGFPASHGCIRMPTRMARIFYQSTPYGTPVQVIGHGSHAAVHDPIPVGEAEPAMVAAASGGKKKSEKKPVPTAKPKPATMASIPVKKKSGGLFQKKQKPQPIPRGTTLYLYE